MPIRVVDTDFVVPYLWCQADPPSSTHASHSSNHGVRKMTVSTTGAIAGLSHYARQIGERQKTLRFQLGVENPKRLALIPGVAPGDVLNVQVHRILPKHHHGLKWSDFPVMKTPIFAAEREFLAWSGRSGMEKQSSGDIRDAMVSQPAFYYDETTRQTHFKPTWIAENRYFAAKVHKAIAPRKPMMVRFRGEADYREVEPAALMEQAAGTLRYNHNYRLNFEAIGSKAIDHVIAKFSSLPKPKPITPDMTYVERMRSEAMANNQIGWFKYRSNSLTEFYGLQTLFALRNATEEERKTIFAYIANWPSTREGPQLTFGGHVDRGVWVGSGKYKGGIDLQAEIGWAMFAGADLGLVDRETDGQVRLTDAGNAFLDLLHADNYDPDAFLRFTDLETMAMPGAQIARIDAWMGRFFHKMKTKVDRLA